MTEPVRLSNPGATVDTLLTTLKNSNLSATHKITRSATIVVAASDSSEKSKAQADYVCDGVDDQDEINAAIAALPRTGNVLIPGYIENLEINQGGKILLLEGSYIISGSIDFSGVSNVTLSGMGPSTVIYNLSTNGSHAIQSINLSEAKNRILVSDLTVVGNELSGDGIHLCAIEYETVRDVYSLSNGGNGITICGASSGGHGAQNKIVSNVQCMYNKLDGLHIASIGAALTPGNDPAIHETLINNSHFEENYRYNIGLFKTIDIHISNCNLEDCYGDYELYVSEGHQLDIANTIFEGSVRLDGGNVQISNSTIYGDIEATSNLMMLKLVGTRGARLLSGSFDHLYVSSSDLKVYDITVNKLMISGSVLDIYGNTSMVNGFIGSSRVYLKIPQSGGNSIGKLTTSNTLAISGCDIENNPGTFIDLAATNAMVTISGCNLTFFTATIQVIGEATSGRLLLASNNIRSPTFNISNIQNIQCSSNLMRSGTITLSSIASGNVNISNNTTSNCTITVNNTCSLLTKQFVQNLGNSVIDNSV